jgi:hypothetical protein
MVLGGTEMYRFKRTYNVLVEMDEARRLLTKELGAMEIDNAVGTVEEMDDMRVIDELVYVHTEHSPVTAECGCCPAVTVVSMSAEKIATQDLF